VIREEKGSILEIMVGKTTKIKEYKGGESGIFGVLPSDCRLKLTKFHATIKKKSSSRF
jgi:hypothetical protein